MNPIIKQTFKQRRWSFFWWIVGITAFIVLEMAFYPTIRDQASELEKSFSKLSDSAVALFSDTGDFFSPVGYLSGQIFYLMLPMLLGVLAIAIGASLIGREEREKTLELILSRPISRKRLIFSKAFAGGLIVFLVGLFGSFITALMAQLVELPLSFGVIMLTGLTSTVLAISFGSVAFMLSCIGKIAKTASVGLAAFYAITGYLLASLSETISWLRWPSKAFPFAYYHPAEILEGSYNWANSLFIIGLTIFCIVTAWFSFRHRDVN